MYFLTLTVTMEYLASGLPGGMASKPGVLVFGGSGVAGGCRSAAGYLLAVRPVRPDSPNAGHFSCSWSTIHQKGTNGIVWWVGLLDNAVEPGTSGKVPTGTCMWVP